MNPETERMIFGYVDPCNPIPGSWKDEVFKFIERAEAKNATNMNEHIRLLSKAYEKMIRQAGLIIVQLSHDKDEA